MTGASIVPPRAPRIRVLELLEAEAHHHDQDRACRQHQRRAQRTQEAALGNEAEHAAGMQHAGDQKDDREPGHDAKAVEVADEIDQQQAEWREFDQIRVRADGGLHLLVAAVAEVDLLLSPEPRDVHCQDRGQHADQTGTYEEHRHWTKRQPIEEQLNLAVEVMVGRAISRLRYQEEQERLAAIREERRRAALAQQAIHDAEKQKLAQLIEDAQRWQQAETIRAFLRAQEAHGQQMGGLSEQQQTFLAWARAKANWLDPLVMQPDAILDQQITIPY